MICKLLRKPIEETRPTVTETPLEVKYPLRYFYPDAIYDPKLPLMRTVFEFDGLPEIFVFHFTAGWNTDTYKDFFHWMRAYGDNGGLCAYYMDLSGQVYQQHHGDTSGYCAGKSKWNGVSYMSSISGSLEIACGGLLDKHGENDYRTNFNKKVPLENRRYVTREMGYHVTGWFEKYAEEQEADLILFSKWLLANGVKEIVGHDDVASIETIGYQRKNDPGGSLSMPLDKWLREYVL